MSKREKLVYKNFTEMSHEWATNPDRDIRCRNGYVEDRVIYSYGRHFPVAYITKDNLVYMTLDTYSSTTAGHIRDVESAVSHKEKLYMLTVPRSRTVSNYEHEKNIGYWISEAKTALGKIEKARDGKRRWLNEAGANIVMMEKYLAHFKVKASKEVKAITKEVRSDKWELQIQEYELKKAAREQYERDNWTEVQAKKEADRIKRAEAKLKAEQKKWTDTIEEWRNGKIYRLPYKYHGGVLLRYNEGEQRVETSKQVQIPVEVAKRFYNRVQKVIKQGGCLDNCNDKILDYTVKEIRPDMLVVGCHNIPMTEVHNIAQQLKWM